MKKIFKLSLLCLVILSLSLAFVGCGGDSDEPAVGAVTVTIEYPDGTTTTGTADIHEGDSYMDCTQAYCQSETIPLVVSGTTYKTVESINNIASGGYGDYGETAGWVYYINGEMVMESAAEVDAEAGAEVLWTYADMNDLDM